MMNFKCMFSAAMYCLSCCCSCFTCRAMAVADTLLILGDSLSAGFIGWRPTPPGRALNEQWQAKTPVVNASISGDTRSRGWLACQRCLAAPAALGAG